MELYGKNEGEKRENGTSEGVCVVAELGAGGGPGAALQSCVVGVQADGFFAMSRALSQHIGARA